MQSHALQSLPEGYREILHLDLQKDKKTATVVNVLAVVLAVVLGIVFHLMVPISSFFRTTGDLAADLLRLLVLLVAMAAYIVLHELTHAAAMKCFGGVQVKFGFTGIYAFAGSEKDYFDRPAYRIIALAPVVVWGVIFALLMALLPREWFWTMAWLQLTNVSGAAGDLYVTWKLHKVPRDTLVRDTGVAMWMYSASGTGE
ncbi:MAG: DUF3267 domain-containing protein [Clostridia bacterium]|nr:DUF3267 domain-containing protein [Clostridia bacterium]